MTEALGRFSVTADVSLEIRVRLGAEVVRELEDALASETSERIGFLVVVNEGEEVKCEGIIHLL